MKKRQVLLFSAQSLLGESLEKSLSQVEELEIAGHWKMDERVLERLASARVDLVIFAEEGVSHDQLSHLTVQILDQYPDLPVFWVTLEHNQMQMFISNLVPACSENLMDLIHLLPSGRQGWITGRENR